MRSATLSVLALLIGVAPATAREHVGFDCGRDIVRELKVIEISPEDLGERVPHAERRATTIVLDAQPGLLANPDALATWNDAVALWEQILQDPITITIIGDLQNLPPNVLGSTSATLLATNYDAVRSNLVADRAGDENYLTQLPTSGQLNIDLPPNNVSGAYFWNGNMAGSKAQLSAIGYGPLNQFDNPSITFSTDFLPDFDFDPTDGITPGKLDFFAVVVHEIGHVLGFTSNIDFLDYVEQFGWNVFNPPFNGSTSLTILDALRLNPGAGAANFTNATRLLTFGDDVSPQVFYDGTQDLGFSTGAYNGDGRQASHWKANELTGGVYIGIMDPTIAPGELGKITYDDIRAFGLIGWDVTYLEDCNENGVLDQFDIWGGTSVDNTGDGIPDECQPVTSPQRRFAQVRIAPNPFNPRTEIQLTLPEAANAKVEIYDLAGRHIAKLADRGYEAGSHAVIWEGKDGEGRAVSSGVYFVLVDVDGEVQQHKVALVR